MPAKHTLRVALTDTLVRDVRGKVADGANPSAGDVVRLALERPIEDEGDRRVQAPASRRGGRHADHP